MTAEELEAWQVRHGLTQVAAARCFRVPTQTYRNWIRGRADVPGPVRRVTELMDIIVRHGIDTGERHENHHGRRRRH